MAWRCLGIVLRLGLLVVVVYYVAAALVRALVAVDWATVHFRWSLVVLGTLVTAASLTLLGEANRLLLGAVHGLISRAGMMAVTWISWLGRYIPGKVASITGGAVLLRRYGVPATVGANLFVLVTVLVTMVGLMLSAPLTLWEPVRERMPLAWVASLGCIAAGCVAVYPPVNLFLVNLLLKALRRPPLVLRHGLRDYAAPLGVILVHWFLRGLALWLLIRAVADVSIAHLPLMVVTSCLAVTAGLVALFAPGGLGVREAVYLLVLSQVVGTELAAIVTVGTRLVTTAAEVGLAAAGFVILRLRPGQAVGGAG